MRNPRLLSPRMMLSLGLGMVVASIAWIVYHNTHRTRDLVIALLWSLGVAGEAVYGFRKRAGDSVNAKEESGANGRIR